MRCSFLQCKLEAETDVSGRGASKARMVEVEL